MCARARITPSLTELRLSSTEAAGRYRYSRYNKSLPRVNSSKSPFVFRGGSRGGSLGSNEPPFSLIYSTYWFLLLLPACLTIIACVLFLFGYCIIFVQSRASIYTAIGEFDEVSFLSIFLGVELASA